MDLAQSCPLATHTHTHTQQLQGKVLVTMAAALPLNGSTPGPLICWARPHLQNPTSRPLHHRWLSSSQDSRSWDQGSHGAVGQTLRSADPRTCQAGEEEAEGRLRHGSGGRSS